MVKRLVVLESPYAGEINRNIQYARVCVKDSLDRGEAPIRGHLLYTQTGILDDTNHFEHCLGIRAGHEWYRVADACVVYIDYRDQYGHAAGNQCGHREWSSAGVQTPSVNLIFSHTQYVHVMEQCIMDMDILFVDARARGV